MFRDGESHSGLVAMSRVSGNHVIKGGADLRLSRQASIYNIQPSGTYAFTRAFTQGPNAQTASTSAGNAIASALLGYAGSGSIQKVYSPAIQSWYHGFYIQEDWKAGKNLTLNLGLRYDLEWPETERWNHISWFNPDLPSPIASQVPDMNLRGAIDYANADHRSPYHADKNNFAPRFGLAYQLSENLVLRTGYGIFYAPMAYGIGGPMGPGWSASTPFLASIDGITPIGNLSDPFPSGFIVPTGPLQDPATNLGQGVSWPDPNLAGPYVQQWNLNVQRKLGNSLVVNVAYSGTKATHLYDSGYAYHQFRADQLGPDLNTQVPNPFYGVIKQGTLSTEKVTKSRLMIPFPQYTSNTLDRPGAAASVYHSAQLTVNKRFSKGFGFLASYTKGKLIDDNSGVQSWLEPSSQHQDFYNRRADRAVSDQDVAQRFVTSFNTSLPFGREGRFGQDWSPIIDGLLGGWQVNGILLFQSGIPLAISTTNTSYANNSALRPNNNGQSARIEGPSGERMDKFFITEVFSAPPLYTFGNVGRNLPDVRGPGLGNLDFSIFKNLKFDEGRFVQFRAEFFNLTNTPEFNNPDTSLQSASFGKITSQRNRPRQIQFGLKLVF
jgi:hypothetical protein